jgi:hypothetical protein
VDHCRAGMVDLFVEKGAAFGPKPDIECLQIQWPFPTAQNKTPVCVSKQGFWNLILTMTYSHMGKPHTTIGDASFHC